MEVTEKLFPLPKVPLGIEIVAWQLHSDDLYPLVHPLRAKCTRCFTMPVIAKELEYREYRSGFFFLSFSHFPPFPQGGKLIPSGRPGKSKQEVKT